MAAIQPFVNLQFFKSTENENSEKFIKQLTRCIQIAGIADADCHTYLNLHLKKGALTCFDQLPEVTRTDYDSAVTTLQERYRNDQRI